MALSKRANEGIKIMTKSVNEAAMNIIRESESLQLKAYVCPAGRLTIGYGHTGVDVRKGMVVTKDQAEALLASDVSKAADTVERLTKGVPVNGNEFGAMVSLCFNIGGTAFAGSTLLKDVNCGRYEQAADQFTRWTHSGGVVLPGLVRRRSLERALFLTPMPSPFKG